MAAKGHTRRPRTRARARTALKRGRQLAARGHTGRTRTPVRPGTALRRRLRDDRGVSLLEFAGFLPILLVVGMAAIQLGLIGYGVNQAGSAARAAARAESLQSGSGNAAGTAAVSGWLSPQVNAGGGGGITTATVTLTVPSVIPLFADVDVKREATMPDDDPDD